MPKNAYRPKDPLVRKLLVRPCPSCGAKVGEPCVVKNTGREIDKVEDMHTARFGTAKRRLITHAAF